MIGTWMLYSIVVTGLLAIAGNFAESACLLARRSTRGVWVFVLVGAIAIPIVAVARPDLGVVGVTGAKPPSSVSGSKTRTVAISLKVLQATQSAGFLSRVAGSLAPYDFLLLRVWSFGSALWLIIVLVSVTRVRRELTRWKESVLDGVGVCVSDDIGPALAGIFSYRIVVPAWVTSLSPEERAFVLAHEREHARVHDPAVIALSALLIGVMPWNAAVWYVQRRLRIAIELDCDTRVLRKLPDVRAYGSLLISVGERSLARLAPVASFAEPKSSLERRIAVMASASPNKPRFRAVLYVATALMLLVAACRAPKPTAAISPADRVRSLSRELSALLRNDPTLATNMVSPELYQTPSSTRAATHGGDPILSARRHQADLDIDTLRFIARRAEPNAFDSVSMPSSVAVGLVLSADDVVLRHSATPIDATGEIHAGYDPAKRPNYTIGGGLMKRLFPGLDLTREIQGITIARVAGKEGKRRVVVIALRTR
jgi:beta-lactamase regulating signal transducer with metallopeptidase domain